MQDFKAYRSCHNSECLCCEQPATCDPPGRRSDPYSGRMFTCSHPPCSEHPGNQEKSLLLRSQGSGLNNYPSRQQSEQHSHVHGDITVPSGAPALALPANKGSPVTRRDVPTQRAAGTVAKTSSGTGTWIFWEHPSIKCAAGLCISLDISELRQPWKQGKPKLLLRRGSPQVHATK